MKRILAFITAIAMLTSFTACEDKKEENIPEEVIQETTETPFRELSDADFTDINVKVSIQDDTPPIEINTLDLSGIDFGEKVAPCKTKEEIESHLPKHYYSRPDVTDWDKNYIESLMDSPFPAMIDAVAMHENMVYFVANYDDMDRRHEYSILSYNTDTEELKELYAVSSLENKYSIYYLKYTHGNLYVMRSSVENDTSESEWTEKYDLCRLDEEKQELIPVAEDVDYSGIVETGDDRLILSYDEYPKKRSGDRITTLKEYDFDSGEWNDIYHGELGEIPVLNGDSIVNQHKNDDKTISIHADNFSIDTQIKGEIFGATDKTVCVIQTNYMMAYQESTVYVYNLERMERYILDISSFGNNVFMAGEHIIVSKGSGQFYYIIPELGAAFFVCFLGGNYTSWRPQMYGNTAYLSAMSFPMGHMTDDEGHVMPVEHTEEDRKTIYYWEN